MFRPLVLLIPVAVWIAGCGASSGSSSTDATTSTNATTTTTSSATASTTSSATTSQTQSATTSNSTHTSQVQSADIRLPVTFVVRSGGKLAPPQIGVPSNLPIQLTVRSGDGAAHHVVLQAPKPTTLSVPASGRASVRINGLGKGTYRLTVDGRPGGQLVIGVSPGP